MLVVRMVDACESVTGLPLRVIDHQRKKLAGVEASEPFLMNLDGESCCSKPWPGCTFDLVRSGCQVFSQHRPV